MSDQISGGQHFRDKIQMAAQRSPKLPIRITPNFIIPAKSRNFDKKCENSGGCHRAGQIIKTSKSPPPAKSGIWNSRNMARHRRDNRTGNFRQIMVLGGRDRLPEISQGDSPKYRCFSNPHAENFEEKILKPRSRAARSEALRVAEAFMFTTISKSV